MVVPDAIDHDTGEERILRRADPLAETKTSFAVRCVLLERELGVDTGNGRDRAGRDLLAVVLDASANVNTHHAGRSRIDGEHLDLATADELLATIAFGLDVTPRRLALLPGFGVERGDERFLRDEVALDSRQRRDLFGAECAVEESGVEHSTRKKLVSSCRLVA